MLGTEIEMCNSRGSKICWNWQLLVLRRLLRIADCGLRSLFRACWIPDCKNTKKRLTRNQPFCLSGTLFRSKCVERAMGWRMIIIDLRIPQSVSPFRFKRWKHRKREKDRESICLFMCSSRFSTCLFHSMLAHVSLNRNVMCLDTWFVLTFFFLFLLPRFVLFFHVHPSYQFRENISFIWAIWVKVCSRLCKTLAIFWVLINLRELFPFYNIPLVPEWYRDPFGYCVLPSSNRVFVFLIDSSFPLV